MNNTEYNTSTKFAELEDSFNRAMFALTIQNEHYKMNFDQMEFLGSFFFDQMFDFAQTNELMATEVAEWFNNKVVAYHKADKDFTVHPDGFSITVHEEDNTIFLSIPAEHMTPMATLH